MNVADGPGITRYEVLMLLARLSFVSAIGFFSMRWIMNQLDPNNKQKKKAKKKVSLDHVFIGIASVLCTRCT